MIDILLPRTDGGVFLQLAAATALTGVVLWRIRHMKEARIFVLGLWVLSIGAMGIRALH